MKRFYFFISILLLQATVLNAQQSFLQKVSIDYVKTVAVWPLMKEMEPEWFDSEKDRMPKQVLSYFNLSTDGSRSLFKKTKDPEIARGTWYRPFADDNVVFNDYSSGTTISQKPVYEENFLVQDSLHKIQWKLTSDTRNIAGFECRKAVGILFDTVGVFAFYTDEIMVPGGPEGITGLPGMILGVGIPRLHTTWFATQVSLDPKLKTIEPATKGKKVTRQEMLDTLHRVMKRWESYGQKLMLGYLI